MSWFSDWGASAWAEELDAAEAQAVEWLDRTAEARGWADYYTGTMRVFITDARAAADGWLTDDVGAFWTTLYNAAKSYTDSQRAAGNNGLPAGWDELVAVWAQAAGTTYTVAAGREAGEVATVVAGTVTETAADVAEAADPRRSWLPWAAGLLVAVGLGVAASGRRG